jgi:hypothetical protein
MISIKQPIATPVSIYLNDIEILRVNISFQIVGEHANQDSSSHFRDVQIGYCTWLWPMPLVSGNIVSIYIVEYDVCIRKFNQPTVLG